jgi:hypothetical protein
MGGGAFDRLKTRPVPAESARQPEIGVADQLKILAI